MVSNEMKSILVGHSSGKFKFSNTKMNAQITSDNGMHVIVEKSEM